MNNLQLFEGAWEKKSGRTGIVIKVLFSVIKTIVPLLPLKKETVCNIFQCCEDMPSYTPITYNRVAALTPISKQLSENCPLRMRRGRLLQQSDG